MRWMGLISEGDSIRQYQNIKEIGVHKCTDVDYEKMNTPLRSSKFKIN